MPPKITIIMPFLNEGYEPVSTVESIYATADPSLFRIVAVNDGGVDVYRHAFRRFPEVEYVRHTHRMGVDGCRNEVGFAADTPYIFIIDSHMRFRRDGWLQRIVDRLDASDGRTVFCTRSVNLSVDNTDVEGTTATGGGANILFDPARPVFMALRWRKNTPGEADLVDVPAVLGATYATTVEWFRRVHGFAGLRQYGLSEELISMKTWMMGGSCKLINDVNIGHLYRNNARANAKGASPYIASAECVVHNRLLTAELLLPPGHFDGLMGFIDPIQRRVFADSYVVAREMLDREREFVDAERDYIQSNSVMGFFDVLDRFGCRYSLPYRADAVPAQPAL